MATLKELKLQAAAKLEEYHALNRRIEKIREKRKLKCTHEKTKIVSQSYFEQGRMSGPIEWKEKVCCRCKKAVATCHNQTKEVWSDATEDETPEIEINMNPVPEVKCIHCKKVRGDHRAKTFACPIGRGSFPHFHTKQFFEAKQGE